MDSLLNKLRMALGIEINEMSENLGVSMVDVSVAINDLPNADAEVIKKMVIFLSQKYTKCECKCNQK